VGPERIARVSDLKVGRIEQLTHTPGDWRWFDYPDGRKLLAGPTRAVLHCPDAPIACDPADQRLIAAAPDLLAALKALVDAVEHREGPSAPVWDQMQAAEAVIAKAEGR
jgi:hypothetical protein